jgi:hypothetical protein
VTKRLKHVIADAVIVIHAHECGYWDHLCHVYQIALPATILENELFYFATSHGKQALNPSMWIKQGSIIRLEADFDDYTKLSNHLSPHFITAIDAGEKEALALLLSPNFKDYLFTTADKAAVKALGVLGLGTRGVSVEELIKPMGSSTRLKLAQHYTKNWFQRNLSEGLSEQHLWLKTP